MNRVSATATTYKAPYERIKKSRVFCVGSPIKQDEGSVTSNKSHQKGQNTQFFFSSRGTRIALGGSSGLFSSPYARGEGDRVGATTPLPGGSSGRDCAGRRWSYWAASGGFRLLPLRVPGATTSGRGVVAGGEVCSL